MIKSFRHRGLERFFREGCKTGIQPKHEKQLRLPLGRAATVEEIAATVALLASDLSAYTTGTIFTIDGGMLNRGSLI